MYLARATGIPLRTDLLTRIRATRTQTTLSRRERARNMNRAFQLRGKPALGNTRCVIVDDVFTTGATTSACARALKAAGATKVCVWTVARGV
jgi:predicted amidophosphoribosyltransferase